MALILNTADLTREKMGEMGEDLTYWAYNALDCCVTEEIYQVIAPQLDKVTSQTYAFSQSLQAPILEMMMRGVLVNQNTRSRIMKKFTKQLAQLESQLNRIVFEGIGTSINWRSPKQLGNLLYDVMGLPEQKQRNTAGLYVRSTGRPSLEALSTYIIAEPLINHLLLLRDVGKALGFLQTGIDPDGRMRCNFNIGGTNTGRLSSSMSDYGTGTNLQNVNQFLREVFVADPGYKFANLDLEQADARNLGALLYNLFGEVLGEREASKFLDFCESGDLHTKVCKLCNPNLPWDQGRDDRSVADEIFYRDKTYRDGSKVLGHGSNYLGQPVTMAKHTKFPVKLVKEFQSTYFRNFPAIPTYHKWVQGQLDAASSLTTLFGRRRFFFGRSNDAATLREAVAYSPQSMTGDEIDIGIINLWRANRVQLLIQVHDSILFQYKEEEEAEIIPWALEALKAPLILRKDRPFVVPTEAKVGWNWSNYNPKKPEENPDGLMKWKGSDSRKRQFTETRLSIKEF